MPQGASNLIENTSPPSIISVYLKVRKGLLFGFELVGALGTTASSSFRTVGADVRWSLLEGFRTGALGALPDLSVGGGVRTLTGTQKFHLTAVGVDVKISKPISPSADSASLTPSLGYQRLIIFGDSTIQDFTPNTDALRECGYGGPDPQTGTPTCRNKLANASDNNVDFNNYGTFDKVRIHRHRIMAGLHYRYEILYVRVGVDIIPSSTPRTLPVDPGERRPPELAPMDDVASKPAPSSTPIGATVPAAGARARLDHRRAFHRAAHGDGTGS
ncbi:MAG: hypothetical protein U0235_33305 [Polyangiaceae bacterium]